jgi:hypothetical protein
LFFIIFFPVAFRVILENSLYDFKISENQRYLIII